MLPKAISRHGGLALLLLNYTMSMTYRRKPGTESPPSRSFTIISPDFEIYMQTLAFKKL